MGAQPQGQVSKTIGQLAYNDRFPGQSVEFIHDLHLGDRLTLAAGEYAVVRVDDAALLRDTWIWLLTNWLPASGRQEKNAPEFERFTSISESGSPIGPVEIWIPLEPIAKS